jgi:2-amino-4-hydroxy-6-hydroxymethyldihydropteridine diphosphokinase
MNQAGLELSTMEGCSLLAVSSVYETSPIGSGYSNMFLNAVIAMKTVMKPEELLKKCQIIEKKYGRESRSGDRTIDIDMLLYDDLVVESESLSIPHPRMHERRFVLEPLCELEPDLIHPLLQKPVHELLERQEVQGQEINKLLQPLFPVSGC